jgi:hypothetical protein
VDYKKHYNLLIERAINRKLPIDVYVEIHHIIPKCMGGNDEEFNLVKLTAEEHYVAHQLLIKIYPGQKGLSYAAFMMSVNNGQNKRNNKQYGWIKRKLAEEFSERMKGNTFASKRKGYSHSIETKEKMSVKSKGKPKSEEHRKKLSLAKKGYIPWNKGLTISDERVKKSMRNLPYNKQENSL